MLLVAHGAAVSRRGVACATYAVHNMAVETVRFARSARKHRVGRAHAMHMIETSPPRDVPAAGEFDPRKVWLGPTTEGSSWRSWRLFYPASCSIVHVMPTALRRKR